MPQPTEHSLEYAVEVAASAETAFRHFTDPRLLVRWLGQRAVLDPRPGGRWSLDVNGVDVVAGRYLTVEPFSRLVFSWSWSRPDADTHFESVVEVDFRENGDVTVVRLRHSGLPAELRDGHDAGWVHYLERLTIAGAGGDPGPDPLATPDIRHGAASDLFSAPTA